LPGDPCPFGGEDSHLSSLLLPPGSTLAVGPPDLTARLLPNRHALLPPPSARLVDRGFGGPLRPVNFRGPQPRRVSCYALLSRWLLLSLRPRCLRLETPFGLSLSGHLGALTPGLGCSPLGVGAYPLHPTPRVYGAQVFGVRKGGGPSSSPYPPIGALPLGLPRRRLSCDSLRRELAITGLDWFFAPSPRSEDRIARQDPFGPRPGFRPASPYPGLDRPVSSLMAMTTGPFGPRPSPGNNPGCGHVGFPAPTRLGKRLSSPWP